MRLLLAALLMVPGMASAQAIVTSPRSDGVAVTVYRDPYRGAAQALNVEWLGGFALISETRRVRLPAGASELRFEGVAGGILPQSAIVSGLGGAVIERNRDAYLLSPGTLLDRSLGERVHLRRTSRANGKVVEEDAIIRSGADGAVVIQTAAGVEALRCSGQSETLLFDRVPAGLSAKPTLAVRVRSAAPVETTVTLSYLASGFDWQANYVARLNAGGDRVDLFAWLTLASSDVSSFVAARTSAVAGKINREYARAEPAQSRAINLRCWPQGSTSNTRRVQEFGVPPPPPPAPSAPPPPEAMAERGDDITVTGSRITAKREDLGDLKLYAIPEPVTVAARSQKQVAMIEQRGVKVDVVYRAQLVAAIDHDLPATRTLVTRNRLAEGLGLPLPAGGIVLFAEQGGATLVVGEGSVDDKAVGEDVEIDVGEAPGVRVRQVAAKGSVDLTVTNDGATPIRFEASILSRAGKLDTRTSLSRRNGHPLWSVTVPANGPRDAPLSRAGLGGLVDRARARFVVDRDEGEHALGDLDLGRAAVARGDDLDPDLHRGAPDLLDLGIDRDQVAQVDRGEELHLVDRDRRDRAIGAARGDDARGDVHLAQHPAAEDMAVGVDVARAGDDAQDGAAMGFGHCSSLSDRAAPASASWPLLLLRKISVISAVPSRTVRPMPSAVAMSMWMWSSDWPRATSATASAAMTIEKAAATRMMRTKRWRIDGGRDGVRGHALPLAVDRDTFKPSAMRAGRRRT